MCLNPIELEAGLLASLKLYVGQWSCSELCQMENLSEVGLEKEQTRMILTAYILFHSTDLYCKKKMTES